MESILTSEYLLLGIAAIIAIFIIVRVVRFLFKVAMIVAVIAFIYFMFFGGGSKSLEGQLEKALKNTTIAQLENKYCAAEKHESVECQCLVQQVRTDLEARLSAIEISNLEQDKKANVSEMLKSFKNKRPEIRKCLESHEDSLFSVSNIMKKMIGWWVNS